MIRLQTDLLIQQTPEIPEILVRNVDDPLQWLPKNVWFSHDSAYPKQNTFERQVQLISCAGDKSVLIWSLRKPSSDDDDEMMDDHDQMHEEQQVKGGVVKMSNCSAFISHRPFRFDQMRSSHWSI